MGIGAPVSEEIFRKDVPVAHVRTYLCKTLFACFLSDCCLRLNTKHRSRTIRVFCLNEPSSTQVSKCIDVHINLYRRYFARTVKAHHQDTLNVRAVTSVKASMSPSSAAILKCNKAALSSLRTPWPWSYNCPIL